MNEQLICEYLAAADAESVDRILNAIFTRRRELFPEWDMIYLALPRNNPEERKLVLEQALNTLMLE